MACGLIHLPETREEGLKLGLKCIATQKEIEISEKCFDLIVAIINYYITFENLDTAIAFFEVEILGHLQDTDDIIGEMMILSKVNWFILDFIVILYKC